tara:strand:- start:338 stop:1978 length:1641 start_codon:yes stop_codon:yes gene_type:complete
MDAGTALVECLIDCGLDTGFTVPGESFLPVLEALRQRRERFRLVSMRHEGGCTFAALGYSARAGKPALVMVSRGPGATNASIGIHAAHQDSQPMVMVIGHVRRHMRGREAFQEIDPVSMFASISKAVLMPETPADVSAMARQAVQLSMAGRPGPVILVLPRDLCEAEAEMPSLDGPEIPTPAAAPAADITALLGRFAAAKKPLIIAGELARRADIREPLADLARRLGAPVIAAYRCQDVLDNTDPAYAGHLEINPVSYQNRLLADADLVVALGSRLDGITSREETLLGDDISRLVHIYPDSDVLQRFESSLAVACDVLPAVTALLAAGLRAEADLTWQNTAHAAFLEFSAAGNVAVAGTSDLAKIAAATRQTLPPEALVLTDGGSFARWIHRYFHYAAPLTQGGSASGAMGASVPGAIGAALAAADHPVVAFAGDGGFMMNGQELSTAVREGIKFVIIVCDNQVHGSILSGQSAKYGADKLYATEMGGPDFVGLAEAYGARGWRVDATADFPAVLTAALMAHEPALIHVTCDAADIVPYGPGKDAV